MKIQGLDSLNKKLDEIARIDVSKGITKAALRVERDAKILVPVDTGTLRSSITHIVEGNEGIVGTSIEYAPNVELGIGQKAQPYLTPALNQNRDQIKQDIIEAINEELQKVAK